MPTSAPDVLLCAGKRQLYSQPDVRKLAVRQAAGTCSQIVACNGCRRFNFISNLFLYVSQRFSPLWLVICYQMIAWAD
jgi:hypothetical protein